MEYLEKVILGGALLVASIGLVDNINNELIVNAYRQAFVESALERHLEGSALVQDVENNRVYVNSPFISKSSLRGGVSLWGLLLISYGLTRKRN